MELNADEIISNTISTINTNFHMMLPSTDNINDYYRYLDGVLNKIRNPKHIPTYLLDKEVRLQKLLTSAVNELNHLKASFVRGDSFGDGMPHGSGDPDAVNKQHIRILELENEIIPYYQGMIQDNDKTIDSLDITFDMQSIKPIEDFIELMPNVNHKNVIMQFYIYHKSYGKISRESFMSEETAKSYRKRGFNYLVDILFNFSKKMH